MRLALAALALTLPAASPARAPDQPKADRAAAPAPICGQGLKISPARVREPIRPKRLGELASGNLTLTVVNRVGACIEPATVRHGYGAMTDGKGR